MFVKILLKFQYSLVPHGQAVYSEMKLVYSMSFLREVNTYRSLKQDIATV